MARLVLSLALTLCFAAVTYASMECPYGMAVSILDKLSPGSTVCPRPWDPPDQSFCCEEAGCCDLTHFMLSGYRLVIIIVIAVVAIGLGVISCCCMCFRRR